MHMHLQVKKCVNDSLKTVNALLMHVLFKLINIHINNSVVWNSKLLDRKYINELAAGPNSVARKISRTYFECRSFFIRNYIIRANYACHMVHNCLNVLQNLKQCSQLMFAKDNAHALYKLI